MKHAIITIAAFLISEPILMQCITRAQVHNLGAELALGLLCPLLLVLFAVTFCVQILSSLYKFFKTKLARHLAPIAIFAFGIGVYSCFFSANSLWIHIVNFYLYFGQ